MCLLFPTGPNCQLHNAICNSSKQAKVWECKYSLWITSAKDCDNAHLETPKTDHRQIEVK